MLFLIAQKIHTSKKKKPESAGEEGEKSNISMHLICIRHSTLQNCTCIPIRN